VSRGPPRTSRIDTSEHVWFANDQLAVRFVEEIDFDCAAVDATAALITAAAKKGRARSPKTVSKGFFEAALNKGWAGKPSPEAV
jgi:hypothetical protein